MMNAWSGTREGGTCCQLASKTWPLPRKHRMAIVLLASSSLGVLLCLQHPPSRYAAFNRIKTKNISQPKVQDEERKQTKTETEVQMEDSIHKQLNIQNGGKPSLKIKPASIKNTTSNSFLLATVDRLDCKSNHRQKNTI